MGSGSTPFTRAYISEEEEIERRCVNTLLSSSYDVLGCPVGKKASILRTSLVSVVDARSFEDELVILKGASSVLHGSILYHGDQLAT